MITRKISLDCDYGYCPVQLDVIQPADELLIRDLLEKHDWKVISWGHNEEHTKANARPFDEWKIACPNHNLR